MDREVDSNTAVREMITSAGTGATRLFLGKLAGRIIGLSGGLMLLMLLSPDDYGLIAIAMASVGIFNLAWELNVGDAATRFIARYLRDNRLSYVKSVAHSSLLFHFAIGSALASAIYLLAEPLAVGLIGKPYIADLAKIAAFGILGTTLFGYSLGALLGLNLTKGYAALMVLQEVLGAFLPLVLVLQGFGVVGALTGMILSWIIAGVVGSAYVLMRVSKFDYGEQESHGVFSTLRELLGFSAPLWAANLLQVSGKRYFGFLMAIFLTAQEAGNLAAAYRLSSIITYFTFPVAQTIYPMFSRIDFSTESRLLRGAFERSVRYSTLLVLPMIALMMLLARPAVSLLIPRYSDSVLYLTILLATELMYGLGFPHATRLLKAQRETRLLAWLTALTTAVGVVAGILLVPTYKVLGLIFASQLSFVPSLIILFAKMAKRYQIGPPLKAAAPIYLSTALAGLLVSPLALQPFSEVVSLVGVIAVGVPLYLLFATLLRAVSLNDIGVFRTAFCHIPVFGRLVEKLLSLMEFVMRRRVVAL